MNEKGFVIVDQRSEREMGEVNTKDFIIDQSCKPHECNKIESRLLVNPAPDGRDGEKAWERCCQEMKKSKAKH